MIGDVKAAGETEMLWQKQVQGDPGYLLKAICRKAERPEHLTEGVPSKALAGEALEMRHSDARREM